MDKASSLPGSKWKMKASAMAPRANWKGFLKIAEVTCPVALFTAASTSERVAFHTINRATGHRVSRQFIDGDTGKPVERDDQVKGYEVGQGDYVILSPDEVAAAVPDSDKTLSVTSFIKCAEIDDVYFDKPYYLAPTSKAADDAYVLIREGMRKSKVAAIAQTVLFRRVRTVLIRAHGSGLIATTLNFDYEVRSADDAFKEVPEFKIEGEMLDLAKHIISTKMGKFDPAGFNDRYDAALADLVKAKLEGKKIKPRPEPKRETTSDLMTALRQSAGVRAAARKTSAKADSKSAKAPTNTAASAQKRKAS
jgi:DNA end-binding protein Ku